MIKREYHTKRECAQCWITEDWNTIQSDVLDKSKLTCYKSVNPEDYGYEDYEGDLIEDIGEPMWSFWFEPRHSFDCTWIDKHRDELLDMGFVLIIEDEWDIVWGLGIDGAGFDFYEAYWIPLYEAMGLKWHDEEDEDETNADS